MNKTILFFRVFFFFCFEAWWALKILAWKGFLPGSCLITLSRLSHLKDLSFKTIEKLQSALWGRYFLLNSRQAHNIFVCPKNYFKLILWLQRNRILCVFVPVCECFQATFILLSLQKNLMEIIVLFSLLWHFANIFNLTLRNRTFSCKQIISWLA